MEKYVIKRTKAYEVFDKLMYAYQHKKFPYNLPTAQPPQIIENMPKIAIAYVRHLITRDIYKAYKIN